MKLLRAKYLPQERGRCKVAKHSSITLRAHLAPLVFPQKEMEQKKTVLHRAKHLSRLREGPGNPGRGSRRGKAMSPPHTCSLSSPPVPARLSIH